MKQAHFFVFLTINLFTLKKAVKFFLIGIIVIGILLSFLNFGMNYFINNELPKIINEKNDTDYTFEYKSVDFSLFNNTLFLNDVKLTPKAIKNNTKQFHYQASIHSIGITGIDFLKLVTDKNLEAHSIEIKLPEISIFKNKITDVPNEQKSKLPESIEIEKIILEKANIKVIEVEKDSLISSVSNLNIKVDVLKMGDYIKSKDLPFTYKNYDIKFDSLFFKLNDYEYVKSHDVHINKSNFEVKNFRILPTELTITEQEHNSKLEIIVPEIKLKDTDWGIKNGDFYLHISKIDIDSVKFEILTKHKKNSKAQIEKTVNKEKIIPFQININDLEIKNSTFKVLNTFDFQDVNIQMKDISSSKDNRLQIKEITLNNPIINHNLTNNIKQKNKNLKPFMYTFSIDKFNINNANYTKKNKQGKNELTVNKFNLSLSDVKMNSSTINKKIPIIYNNLEFKTGEIYYNTGKYYDLRIKEINIIDKVATISKLNLTPKLSKKEFDAQLKYGTDLYTLSAEKIILQDFNFGFNDNDMFFLKLDQMDLNEIKANIYRNASIPNAPILKKLYSQKLREINFGLEIPQINIKNSTLVYQEVSKKNLETGTLTFNNFNANIKNICSGYNRKSTPITQIDVNTIFMKQAIVNVNWSFNILNSNDTFNIKGTVKKLPVEAMNPFLKPYLNISGTGIIDEIDFNFNGNNNNASGTFAMNYEHLNISIFKGIGEHEKKRVFLSDIANLVMKKNTHGKNIEHETKTVEREKEKGFFSFFWLNLKQGLKQTLLL